MKIAILYTGGTIGSIGDPLSPMSYEDFKNSFEKYIVPIVNDEKEDISFEYLDFGTSLDSTNLVPTDWCKMLLGATVIKNETKVQKVGILDIYDECDGFIILHGTDTMAYSASVLSYFMTQINEENTNIYLDKPLVITGSQLPLFSGENDDLHIRYYTDALNNIFGAISTIEKGINEVSIFFDNILIRGNRSLKTNANFYDAFSSPNYPNLANYGIKYEKNSKFLLDYTSGSGISIGKNIDEIKSQIQEINNTIMDKKVVEIVATPTNPEFLADIIEGYIDLKVDGIILQSFGEGNFPSGDPQNAENGCIYKALEKASKNNIIIINCTQVIVANVDSGVYEAGSWLSKIGAIDAHDMTPIAVYTKLMYLFALGYKKEEIDKLIRYDIAGEISKGEDNAKKI